MIYIAICEFFELNLKFANGYIALNLFLYHEMKTIFKFLDE